MIMAVTTYTGNLSESVGILHLVECSCSRLLTRCNMQLYVSLDTSTDRA